MSKTPEELADRACRSLTKGADYRTQALLGALAGGAGGALSGYISADEGEVKREMLTRGLLGAAAGGIGVPVISRFINRGGSGTQAGAAKVNPQASAASDKPEGTAPAAKPAEGKSAPRAGDAKAEPAAPPLASSLKEPVPRTDLQDLQRNIFIAGHNLMRNRGAPYIEHPESADGQDIGMAGTPLHSLASGTVGAGVGYTGSRALQSWDDVSLGDLLRRKNTRGIEKAMPDLATTFGRDLISDAVRKTDAVPFIPLPGTRDKFRKNLVDGADAANRALAREAASIHSLEASARAAKVHAARLAQDAADAVAADPLSASKAKADAAAAAAAAERQSVVLAAAKANARATPKADYVGMSAPELDAAARQAISTMRGAVHTPEGWKAITQEVLDARHARAKPWMRRGGVAGALLPWITDSIRSYREAQSVVDQGAKGANQ